MTGILILVRHGESEWNLKNLFTGWRNPDLTEKGIAEAKRCAQDLNAEGLIPDYCFTSALKRAQHTLDLILEEMGILDITITRNRALNERDYGDLSRSQQGRGAQEVGRGAGADLAPLLRRAPAGRRVAQGHGGAHPALLPAGDRADGDGRQDRARRGARQLAARAGDGDRVADARADPQARDRDRPADDLPAQGDRASSMRSSRWARRSAHKPVDASGPEGKGGPLRTADATPEGDIAPKERPAAGVEASRPTPA